MDRDPYEPEQKPHIERCNLAFVLALVLSSSSLSVIATLNASWQVVRIDELRSEHQHGLWLDCARYDRIVLKSEDELLNSPGLQHLNCTYKILFQNRKDIVNIQESQGVDQNSADAETERHQFFEWHKSTLICIVLSCAFNVLAIAIAICASCSSGCTAIFAILLMLSFASSLLADLIFFICAHRVDNRFVSGLIATYEQHLGVAFYVHCVSTFILFLSLVLALVLSYQMITTYRPRKHNSRFSLNPLYMFRGEVQVEPMYDPRNANP